MSTHEQICNQWRADNGDQTHRLNYDLNKDSLVFDVGGYQGWWTQEIWNKFHCNIFTFEPIPPLYEHLVNATQSEEKIKIFGFGLSSENKNIDISILGDGSSFYLESKHKVQCKVRSIKEFLEEQDIDQIDLMKINIEGDEYPLLESIIEHGLITKIKNIQIQFHHFMPNAIKRRNNIHEEFKKTHECTWNYEYVWENWKRL